MSFCTKCRKAIKVTLADACVICGITVASPTVAAQHSAGAAATMTVASAPRPVFSSGGYALGNSGDHADPSHGGEPEPTFDGPLWDHSGTGPTTPGMFPAPHDD